MLVPAINYQNFLSDLAFPADKTAILERIETVAATFGVDQFRTMAVQGLIEKLNPGDIIPAVYRAYRAIVQDGLEVFLSKMSVDRLMDILADQCLLAENASGGQRLFELAKKCPTLHKLGQIIARNKHLHPNVRKWFVHLENGDYGTSVEKITVKAEKEVCSEKEIFSINIGRDVISEASVGAICPCDWKDPETGAVKKSVIKILKPKVRSLLTEELEILEAVASFFQRHANRYTLDDFAYVDVFRDIRQALAEEINLLGEQSHLWDAFHFYDDRQHVKIPKLAPFSTKNLTAMTRLDGVKITDAAITDDDKKDCAVRLFTTLILKPLFSTSSVTIFHGDPHAGNILAYKAKKDHPVTISIVDWSLAGYLTKTLRVDLLNLFQQVIMGKVDDIERAIAKLGTAEESKGDITRRSLKRALVRLMASKEYAAASLMKKVFLLIDGASRVGMVFCGELLLFRKALFTLEGVLWELDSEFNVDDVMTVSLRMLFLQELPKRLGVLLFPTEDTPEKYASLMSNKDLQRLLFHYMSSRLKNGSVKILALRHFLKTLGTPMTSGLPCELAV